MKVIRMYNFVFDFICTPPPPPPTILLSSHINNHLVVCQQTLTVQLFVFEDM